LILAKTTKKKKRIIPRHLELSETERQAKILKRAMKNQNKVFKEAHKMNRPRLDKEVALKGYSAASTKTGKKLARLALRVMSLQTAFDYARSMINQDIAVEGVEWDTNIAFREANKIQRIQTLRILLDHFKVPIKEANEIINQAISKEFGLGKVSNAPPLPVPNRGSVTTVTPGQIRKVLQQYGKDIEPQEP
jgi:hypothetical protein